MTPRTQAARPCTENFAAARLTKASGFMEAAELTRTFDDAGQLRDALVTLCIHSGIASADVICCKRLGEHYSGENHSAAADVLARADDELAEQLRRLLRIKTKAGYSGAPASADDEKVANRAATRLLAAARAA